MKNKIVFLSLFTSVSTIICCALPIILVTLGMGAVFASLTANIPSLIWLAQKSAEIFLIAGFLLLMSGYFIYIKPTTCPADKKLAVACKKTKKFSKIIFLTSLAIYLISLFFKYGLILLIR